MFEQDIQYKLVINDEPHPVTAVTDGNSQFLWKLWQQWHRKRYAHSEDLTLSACPIRKSCGIHLHVDSDGF